MPLTVGEVQNVLTEAQGIGDAILVGLSTLDSSLAAPDAIAKEILDLLAKYGGLALQAIAGASNTPINAATVLALLPDTTPLPPPPAA
jgi:hypothetical protein